MQNLEKLNNLSKISIGEFFGIIPESYLVLMSVIGLIIVGTSNFIPASNEIEKKLKVTPAIYDLAVNSLWLTILLYILQLIFFYNRTLITFSGYSINDFYTVLIKIIVILTTILICRTSHSRNQTKSLLILHPKHLIEYPILLLLLTLFLMILISSYNFITVFFGILGFSLNLYVLILNDGFNQASREAGIKYFYLSTISSGLLLCGIFLIYLMFHSTGFISISWLIHNWIIFETIQDKIFLISIMLYFIIFGFLFKLSGFPGHLWAPEVYDGSPNNITALFVLPIKIATFALFLRILTHTFGELYLYWHAVLWIAAFFSMFWGCFGALIEQNIKRFMAYSSINQMGFLLMGLTCGTFEGIRAALIYLLLYVIMNAGFFLVFLTTREINSNKPLIYLTDFNLFAQTNYLYSIGLVIIFFSMAGIPPLGGFFGKYFIFLHSFETGHLGLVFMGMVTSIIGAYYYLRIVKILWFEKRKIWNTINQQNLISNSMQNKIRFQTDMQGNLLEVYVGLEFLLIWFLIWSPIIFQMFNFLTTLVLHPLV